MKNAHIKNAEWLAAAGIVAAFGMTTPAQAADWIMLQGTEPADRGHLFFGAAELTYTANQCDRLSGLAAPNGTATGNVNAGPGLNNGRYVNNCRVGPELRDETSGLYVNNLLLGVRGNIVPERINYFLAANAGENATTYLPFKTSRERLVSLTDASVTFSYIPGVRIRVGLFKKPGPEELLQGLEASDYAVPTDFVNRVQVERFVKGNSKNGTAIPGQGYAGSISAYGYDADAGRDWGVQFFDAFKSGPWTHTYAVMVSNGNGIHHNDNNSNKDVNLYWSSEHDLTGYASQYALPVAKGPLKHGVKLYGYYQRGVRNFIVDAAGTKSQDFDRIRYGVGIKALGHLFGENRGKHRLGLELMYADGMVFTSPTGNVADGLFGGNTMQFAAEKGNKARGITLDYGYYLNKNWQFDLRYSRDDLLYKTAGVWLPVDERVYTDITVGVNYHFSPKTRLTFDYTFRDVKAPNAAVAVNSTAPAINNAAVQTRNNDIMTSSVGNRLDIRLSHAF
jgi:hypothetical protein